MKRTGKKSLKSQIKKHSRSSISSIKESHVNEDDLLPMGSTLLNLAMSDTIHGGAKKGTMINIIGASHGGKTILALTSFAEANLKSSFDDYFFIYDDAERANAFNMEEMFGKETALRIIAPREDKTEDKYSVTVQHFHCNLLHWLEKDKPFMWVLDSFDSLDTLEDQKKVEEMAVSFEKGKQTAGSYGTSKAKAASSMLKSVVSKLNNTQSALFIISQTRDNIDTFSFQKETRSGGRALKFYAFHEMWLKPVKSIKRNDTIIGHTVRVKVTKNKITGKYREVEFDIYEDYGIDDIGSCVDYLLKMGRWTGGGASKINTKKDFDLEPCTRAKLIRLIEENEWVYDLKKIVGKTWHNFEDSIKLNRKNKYA